MTTLPIYGWAESVHASKRKDKMLVSSYSRDRTWDRRHGPSGDALGSQPVLVPYWSLGEVGVLWTVVMRKQSEGS